MCKTEEDLPEIEIAQSLMECGLCKYGYFLCFSSFSYVFLYLLFNYFCQTT